MRAILEEMEGKVQMLEEDKNRQRNAILEKRAKRLH